MQEAPHDLINNCRALTNCQGLELDINGHTLPFQSTCVFNGRSTQHLRQHTFQDIAQAYSQQAQINTYIYISPCSDCKCTRLCVPLLLPRIFHFIISLVCDDRDNAVVTEMSGGGGGGWNWTGNYVLQLRHEEEILKAILQCLGTGCRKGGCNGKRQFNQNPRLSCRAGGVEEERRKRDRTAMFNNVLGISVVECTIVWKMHDVIQQQNEPKTKGEWKWVFNVTPPSQWENSAAAVCRHKSKHLT